MQERATARKRVLLKDAFDKLDEDQKEFAYEVRASMLVDIRTFNINSIIEGEGIISSQPSAITHFENAEKQRDHQRNAKRKSRDNESHVGTSG